MSKPSCPHYDRVPTLCDGQTGICKSCEADCPLQPSVTVDLDKHYKELLPDAEIKFMLRDILKMFGADTETAKNDLGMEESFLDTIINRGEIESENYHITRSFRAGKTVTAVWKKDVPGSPPLMRVDASLIVTVSQTPPEEEEE